MALRPAPGRQPLQAPPEQVFLHFAPSQLREQVPPEQVRSQSDPALHVWLHVPPPQVNLQVAPASQVCVHEPPAQVCSQTPPNAHASFVQGMESLHSASLEHGAAGASRPTSIAGVSGVMRRASSSVRVT